MSNTCRRYSKMVKMPIWPNHKKTPEEVVALACCFLPSVLPPFFIKYKKKVFREKLLASKKPQAILDHHKRYIDHDLYALLSFEQNKLFRASNLAFKL